MAEKLSKPLEIYSVQASSWFLKLILWHLWVSCVWNASIIIIIITLTTLIDIKRCIIAGYMNKKLVSLGVFELCYYFSKWLSVRFSGLYICIYIYIYVELFSKTL